MSLFFINDAIAATTTATANQAASGGYGSIFLLVAFVLIFYFMLLRPQQKRAKDHRSLVEGLVPGDEVITSGGLLGRITKISDDFITLAIAENVEIKIQKAAVSTLIPKGTIKSI